MKYKTFEKGDNGALMVNEVHPLYGDIERPARQVEGLVYRARTAMSELVGQALAALGNNQHVRPDHGEQE